MKLSNLINTLVIFLASTPAVELIDSNLWFYAVAVIAGMLAKIGIFINSRKTINWRTVFVALTLTLVGGIIGYVVGLAFFLDKVFIRFMIICGSTFLGEIGLVTLAKASPKLFNKILQGWATSVVNKMGVDVPDVEQKQAEIKEECKEAISLDEDINLEEDE